MSKKERSFFAKVHPLNTFLAAFLLLSGSLLFPFLRLPPLSTPSIRPRQMWSSLKFASLTLFFFFWINDRAARATPFFLQALGAIW